MPNRGWQVGKEANTLIVDNLNCKEWAKKVGAHLDLNMILNKIKRVMESQQLPVPQP